MGFNQKMDLVVDIFTKTLNSSSDGPTKEQFDVFVQKLFEIYEKAILSPKSLATEIHSTVVQSRYHPIWEKYKRLRSISFSDFQQFCRSFCERVNIEAMMSGNMDRDYALHIMQIILNNFQCKRYRIVSMKFNLMLWE